MWQAADFRSSPTLDGRLDFATRIPLQYPLDPRMPLVLVMRLRCNSGSANTEYLTSLMELFLRNHLSGDGPLRCHQTHAEAVIHKPN